MPAPCLEVERVTVRRGTTVVVDAASLRLGEGAIVTIEGASGSGKSTLLRAIATLLPTASGTLSFRGLDVATLSLPDYRRQVAYVPQLPPMFDGTVAENVAAGPRFRGATLAADVVAKLLTRVSLDAGLATRAASSLSGGEKLRVALARALANEPVALLLDEPTSALDPASAHHIVDLVVELARAGTAVLAVTHSAEHAARLGGLHYRMTAGVLGVVAPP